MPEFTVVEGVAGFRVRAAWLSPLKHCLVLPDTHDGAASRLGAEGMLSSDHANAV